MDYNIILNQQVSKLLDNYDDSLYAPQYDEIFKALELTPLSDVTVVFLGQDPYPRLGDACGLSFSVNRSDKLPASLKNIYKELYNDLKISRTSGDLSDIAKQGVLFLNTILTIKIGETNSHAQLGWQETTDNILKQISDKGNVVFVLLGNQAQKYERLIDIRKNTIIKQVHPSPLSAYRGFFGSKIFSQINDELIKYEHEIIDWKENTNNIHKTT